MTGFHKRNEAADLADTRLREDQNNNRQREHRSTPWSRRGEHPCPFVVVYRKFSGAMREYARYADRDEAQRVCKLLRWAGAVAEVRLQR
jgi:hypothetical protein